MKELWIDLQPDSPRALYEQIYEYIRKDIADGKISPGEKLPSTRFMAKNLQISRSTVELAYEQNPNPVQAILYAISACCIS